MEVQSTFAYWAVADACMLASWLACLALLPNTNSMASMTLDLPLPFGPTTAEKDCVQAGACMACACQASTMSCML